MKNGARCRRVVFCERRKKVEHDGGGKHIGDVEFLDGCDDFLRVGLGGDGEGDIWDDGGDAEQEVDQCVEGEGWQVNFVGSDIEGVLKEIQLGGEVGLGVDCPFGKASAAGGIDDDGGCGRRMMDDGRWIDLRPLTLRQVQGGAFDAFNCQIVFYRVPAPPKEDAYCVSEWVADENIGLGFFEDLADFFQADGRIEDDGDDAEFEQGNSEREKVYTRGSHHSGGHARGQLAGLKSKKEAVSLGEDFSVGESLPNISVKIIERGFVRMGAGGLFEFCEEVHAGIL